MSLERRPFVGIAVLVLNPREHPDCVLVSERLSSHGKGLYQLPGGHLEFGETFVECGQRELKEETNLDSSQLELVYITNTIFEETNQPSKHYVTIFLRTILDDCSNLKCLEPEKNSEWTWMKWEELKSMKLFQPLHRAVHDQHLNPFEQTKYLSS